MNQTPHYMAAMSAVCEREGCEEPGRGYQRFGKVVATPPGGFTWNTGPGPEQPITLCRLHALESFGFADTTGEPS